MDNSLYGYIVKVIFSDFQLESLCFGDRLKFYDGMNTGSSLLGSYCGTTHPDVIYSSGQYLYVKFQTSSFGTDKGFSFSFSAVKEGTFTVYSLELFNFLKLSQYCLLCSLFNNATGTTRQHERTIWWIPEVLPQAPEARWEHVA